MKHQTGLANDHEDRKHLPSRRACRYADLSGHSVISVLIGWFSRKTSISSQYFRGSDLLRAVR